MAAPVRFEEIKGQPAAIALLGRALEAGRLPHALLFHGPDGVGKTTLARALAATLLCDDAGSSACGRCSPCLRVAAGKHPDVLFVRRLSRTVRSAGPLHDPQLDEKQPGDLSALIRVFQIRELAAHAGRTPIEGARRVFIVDPADRMNDEAQNALLKTLEEPPASSVLILVSARAHLLLPTVRSRCVAIAFGTLPVTGLLEVLARAGVDGPDATARAALAAGRPGLALRMDPDELLERRDGLLEMLEQVCGEPPALARLSEYSPLIAGQDQDDCLLGLELLETLLRDVSRSAGGGARDPSSDETIAPRVDRLAGRVDAAAAADLVFAVERLRGELRFNVNRTLLAETLLTRIAASGP